MACGAATSSPGVWLKLAKKGNDAPCIGKAAAIDGALIHGWIDGQAQPYDADCWLVRFTPRKSRIRRSEINLTRAPDVRGGRDDLLTRLTRS